MLTQSVTDTQGLESVVPDSNISFPTATDTTMNSIDLLGDLRYVDWGNNFWSDWLFPIGMVAEEPASPYYPDSTPEMVGIQGIAPSASDHALAEVWQPKASVKETIKAILPLPYTTPSMNQWPVGKAEDAQALQSVPRLGPTNRASEASFFHLPAMTEDTLIDMSQAIQMPTVYTPWRSLSLEYPLTGADLDECVDLYFANFHPVNRPVNFTLQWINAYTEAVPFIYTPPNFRHQQKPIRCFDCPSLRWCLLFRARRCL